MPKLVIDNQEIEVEPGTKVIEAAERLDIMIPRFCYHPAMGSVGACRVCAVKFLQGPFKGVQMSCMVACKDGMVVSTTDEEAVDFRRHVIEWLMLHHPHDCPVCDEGGHCLLQDMTISGGHGLRRYLGPKRTYRDQDLGPLVQHEMNRCIHCYRCSRYYQEYSGYRDLGVMQIGNRTYFGRFQDGVLESPFAGNLSDICPTGVYTDKPSRYKGRRWDYERTPSICIHCSLGCHVTVSARYREVVRHEARFSDTVNGHFICDRGRFGFYYTEDRRRPRRAIVDGDPVSFGEAVRSAADRLRRIEQRVGSDAVACIGSVRSSLNTLADLGRLCRSRGWRGPAVFGESTLAGRVKTAVERLEPGIRLSMRALEKADFVLVLGADPVNEAPMLGLALRQAQRAGAGVAVIDPRPVSLPLAFDHLAAFPGDLTKCFGAVLRSAVAPSVSESLGPPAARHYESLPTITDLPPAMHSGLEAVIRRLRESRQPAIVCGTMTVPDALVGQAADAALLLRAAGKEAGVFFLLPGANGFGAGILNRGSLQQVIEGIESGAVRAVLLIESDPLREFPDRRRMEKALDRLELLVVLDYLDSASAARAQVRLPTTTVYEAGGLFINQEGRLQRAHTCFRGGISILRTGRGDHPPRIYSAAMPGDDPQPAAQVLAAIGGYEPSYWPVPGVAVSPEIKSAEEIPDAGVCIDWARPTPGRFERLHPDTAESPRNGFFVILTEWTFGTEELSSASPCLRKVEKPPVITMYSEDAERLGLTHGDSITVETDCGHLTLPLCISSDMAPGVLIVPRHRRSEWQMFAANTVAADRIRKADVAAEGEVHP